LIPEDTIMPHSSADILPEIFDATRECIFAVSGEMTISAANRSAEMTFSRIGTSIVGRRLSEVIRNADLHDAFRDALENDRGSELRINMPGPVRNTYDVQVSPIELDGARYAIGFFYDITKLERLEIVRQEFLSNISHELRTPLTSILAFVETLEDGAIEDGENNRRFLGVIRRNAERMQLLISDILELSMIESGKVSIEPRSVELRPLVDEILMSVSSKASAREVTLENHIAPGVFVKADRVRLEQMLVNLIDNAVKFNRQGGRVTVSVSETPEASLIDVSDTGEGLLPEHIERIFERFYRVDKARSREAGGTGLGLAIVKHLGRLHGGEVRVSSKPGQGSTFTIQLPW
jgi:two-component system phosphate regulon sensor histidine kinase PhoR